jgi:hypothetical protein
MLRDNAIEEQHQNDAESSGDFKSHVYHRIKKADDLGNSLPIKAFFADIDHRYATRHGGNHL